MKKGATNRLLNLRSTEGERQGVGVCFRSPKVLRSFKLMRRIEAFIALTCIAWLLPDLAADAATIPKDPAEITQEITLRCMYDMGEFGQVGMEACVEADLAAVEALRRYPPEAQPVIDRCFQGKWTLGYSVVQQCVEKELGTRND